MHFRKCRIYGKIINRSTIEISYSRMPNFEKQISQLNKKVFLSKIRLSSDKCTCT